VSIKPPVWPPGNRGPSFQFDWAATVLHPASKLLDRVINIFAAAKILRAFLIKIKKIKGF
jgi:hypothetical protein